MRMRDWSSYVCSSYLFLCPDGRTAAVEKYPVGQSHRTVACPVLAAYPERRCAARRRMVADAAHRVRGFPRLWAGGDLAEIGRASCRDRVCQYVLIMVVSVALKKQTQNKIIFSK